MYALFLPPYDLTKKRKRTTPNLLPCTIHHNGPVPTSKRYWSPATTTSSTKSSDTSSEAKAETKTSYFRGRKLQGRTLKVPTGYNGVVLRKTDKVLAEKGKIPTSEKLRARDEGVDDEDGMGDGLDLGREEDVEVKMLEQQAEFDELVVWGHEMVPDGEDVYVRGVEEWVAFAEAIHCDDQPIAAESAGQT